MTVTPLAVPKSALAREAQPKPPSEAPPVPRPAPRPAFWHVLLAHRLLLLGLVGLIGLGAWQGARILFGPEVVVDKMIFGNLVQTVVVSGHVETPYRVEIGSQITGTVQEVLVEEGQRVAKGDPLISIEASELTATVVQAEGALAQAKARLRQLQELTLPAAREQLTQAKATLLNAQQTYDRTAALARNAYATQAALDTARRDLDIARTLARTAELQVFTSSPGGSDYVMAETQRSQAEANLATARSRLGYATLAAPRDGVLISRSVERGTIVQPGKTLLVLAPAGTTQLVVEIDEKNLGLLRLGEPALASADAFPDERFAAQVAYINPGIDITRASVEVKLEVPEPPRYLIQDMTVSVDVEVGRRDRTLIVPRRNVHDALTGTPWLMVVDGGRARQRPVRLGLMGSTQVEILDGAVAGDLVVPGGAGVRTGQRLRPVLP